MSLWNRQPTGMGSSMWRDPFSTSRDTRMMSRDPMLDWTDEMFRDIGMPLDLWRNRMGGMTRNPSWFQRAMEAPYWATGMPFGGEMAEPDALRVTNDDSRFAMSMDVRQFRPEEITVKTVNDMVEIEAKHDERFDEPNRRGSVQRHFVRKYKLPEDVDPNSIQSNLTRDGVLSVQAPKRAIEGGRNERNIPIEMGGSGSARSALQ